MAFLSAIRCYDSLALASIVSHLAKGTTVSKKLPLTILLLTLVATPAMASLQCTIQCLAENQSCDEGPTICAMLFEVCMDLCDNPPVFELTTPTDSSSETLFFAEPWFARPAASPSCQTVSN